MTRILALVALAFGCGEGKPEAVPILDPMCQPGLEPRESSTSPEPHDLLGSWLDAAQTGLRIELTWNAGPPPEDWTEWAWDGIDPDATLFSGEFVNATADVECVVRDVAFVDGLLAAGSIVMEVDAQLEITDQVSWRAHATRDDFPDSQPISDWWYETLAANDVYPQGWVHPFWFVGMRGEGTTGVVDVFAYSAESQIGVTHVATGTVTIGLE